MILVLRPYAVSARTQGQNSKGGMSLHGESMHDKKGSKSVDEYGSGLSII